MITVGIFVMSTAFFGVKKNSTKCCCLVFCRFNLIFFFFFQFLGSSISKSNCCKREGYLSQPGWSALNLGDNLVVASHGRGRGRGRGQGQGSSYTFTVLLLDPDQHTIPRGSGQADLDTNGRVKVFTISKRCPTCNNF